MTMNENTILDRLRTLTDPSTKKDIVAGGLVQALRMSDRVIQIDVFPPNGDLHLHDALSDAIRRTLEGVEGLDKVVVTVATTEGQGNTEGHECGCQSEGPVDDTVIQSLPVLNPTGAGDDSFNRIGEAGEAGYGECGPEAIPSPESEAAHQRWDEWPPVYQWEIDPSDSTRKSGEADVKIGDWDYEIWWQGHPSDLVYAAIQALKDDTVFDGPERTHPSGRNVVVNLVYDLRREAVVAIYGTARDFRPFVEAFRAGCDQVRQAQESKS